MMSFTVIGRPAPQGSKRHIGGGRMIESSKAAGPWREAVRAETAAVMATGGYRPPIEGPVQVALTFVLPRPRGHYGTGRNAARIRDSAPKWPAGKPDIDKLTRAVLDGITAGGAIRDDSQVVLLAACKEFGDLPCCKIVIQERES